VAAAKPVAAPKPAPAPPPAAPPRPAARPAPPKPRPAAPVEEDEPVAVAPSAASGGIGRRDLLMLAIGFGVGIFCSLCAGGLGWLLSRLLG
jgi:hypothetical protein